MTSKIGEMKRLKRISDKAADVAFMGRTLHPSIPQFEITRDRMRKQWAVKDGGGQRIGKMTDAGCDEDGRDLYNLIYWHTGTPVLLACVEVQPDLFAVHLRAEDQACLPGVVTDLGAL